MCILLYFTIAMTLSSKRAKNVFWVIIRTSESQCAYYVRISRLRIQVDCVLRIVKPREKLPTWIVLNMSSSNLHTQIEEEEERHNGMVRGVNGGLSLTGGNVRALG